MTAAEPEPDHGPDSGSACSDRRWVAAGVVVAVLVRLVVLFVRSTDLTTDPDVYVAMASTVQETGGFNSPGTDSSTAFRPPLYPLALALLMKAGTSAAVATGLLALLSGAVIIPATWDICVTVGLSPRWCVLAMMLVALDPLLLRYTSLPMTESASAALLTAAVAAALRFDASQRIQFAVAAGLCFGLAGLSRPVCFVTCALVTVACICRAYFGGLHERAMSSSIGPDAGPRDCQERHPLVARLLKACIPALIAGCVLLPWIVRNALLFGEFIPLTTHGGYTLLLGNNERFYAEVVLTDGHPVWQHESRQAWQQQLDAEADPTIDSETELDAWMYDRAFRVIRENPAAFRSACWLRWRRFWAVQPRLAGDFANPLVLTAVGIWYAAQWIGLIASLRSLWTRNDLRILWVTIASFLIVHSFYWTNTRMRAPLTAVIVVLSLTGWRQLWRVVRPEK